jgi:hypothetical protein
MAGIAGITEFQLSFQVSPIMLTHGIADNFEGGMLPIISITDSADFESILQAGPAVPLDDFFAQYIPVDALMVENDIAQYPFANQSVAANAIIVGPLALSLRMICPVKDQGGYKSFIATMSNLQSQLAKHNLAGGTYTVATPAMYYTECLLRRLVQISGGPMQAMQEWRWDFFQPLLTLAQAAQSQNNLMQKLSNGTAFRGEPAWSGAEPTIGVPPSLVTGGAGVVPAAQGASGSNATAPTGFVSATGSLQQ